MRSPWTHELIQLGRSRLSDYGRSSAPIRREESRRPPAAAQQEPVTRTGSRPGSEFSSAKGRGPRGGGGRVDHEAEPIRIFEEGELPGRVSCFLPASRGRNEQDDRRRERCPSRECPLQPQDEHRQQDQKNPIRPRLVALTGRIGPKQAALERRASQRNPVKTLRRSYVAICVMGWEKTCPMRDICGTPPAGLEVSSPESILDQRFPGGAGWTRTSDRRIMSPALGTALTCRNS
jgi:hypothetical protein